MNLGSARVSRVGFGVSPKLAFLSPEFKRDAAIFEVHDGEDAVAHARDARAPQTTRSSRTQRL
jgi:hypothetical protein